ncbi:MAG: hypothetical protein KJ623_01645 [Nanoarchaeota archaeon]|nr:hypothetical protein [Nanoarchaeota archaeon]MBU0962766.1 hypothetical protein [Nanoarchaeota archaeon]
MKVNELKDRAPVDELTLKITEKGEAREVRGGQLKVCNAKGEDDTGSVTVSLWNNDIEKVNIGDTIKITNGWSSIYNNEMQVSPGKLGKLEVV